MGAGETAARAVDVFGAVALINLKRLAAFGAIAVEDQRRDSAGSAGSAGLGTVDLLVGVALVRGKRNSAFRAAAIRARRDRRAALGVTPAGFGAIDVLPGIVGAGAEASAAVGADPGGGSVGGLTAALGAIAAVRGVTREWHATLGANPGDAGGGEDIGALGGVVQTEANQHPAVESRIETVEAGFERVIKSAEMAAAAIRTAARIVTGAAIREMGTPAPTAERDQPAATQAQAQTGAEADAEFGVGGVVEGAENALPLAEGVIGAAGLLRVTGVIGGGMVSAIPTLAAGIGAVDAGTPATRLGDRRAAGTAMIGGGHSIGHTASISELMFCCQGAACKLRLIGASAAYTSR